MRSWVRSLVVPVLFIGLAACGGSSNSSPTTPTPTPPAPTPNRAPSVTGMNITPSFGISQLTSFAMAGSATDPDNDSLTYTWDFGDGTQSGGQNVSKLYTGGGAMTVRLTVSDGKSAQGAVQTATGSDTRTINVGTMAGRWRLTTTACPGQNQDFTMTLAQSGGTVTGTFEMPNGFCNGARGLTGKTDPAEPGTFNANGHVSIRFKAGVFLDFYFRGDMQAPGSKVVGGVFNSGFGGQSTTLDKIG